jgi:uncharacterized RDD family membrane protein YckC
VEAEIPAPDAAAQPTLSPPYPENEVRYISGFWRRFLAFSLDMFLLLLALSYPVYRWSQIFFLHPGRALLVGFTNAFIYFVIMNSRVGHGQTVGKRATGIRVVDIHGDTISPARSALRFLMFATPFFLIKVTFIGDETIAAVDTLIGWVFTAWILIDVYLFAFNRRTGQSLHDLVAASYVIETSRWPAPQVNVQDPPGPPNPADLNPSPIVTSQRVWLGHGKTILVGLTASLVFAMAIWPEILSKSSYLELMRIQQAVLRSGKAQRVGVQMTIRNWKGNHIPKRLQVTFVPSKDVADEVKQAAEIAAIVLEASPNALGADFLDISNMRAADFGFLQYSAKRTISHTPEQWKIVILATGAAKEGSAELRPGDPNSDLKIRLGLLMSACTG